MSWQDGTLIHRKIRHAVDRFKHLQLRAYDIDRYRARYSVEALCSGFATRLTKAGRTLLDLPLSKWSIDELQKHSIDSSDLNNMYYKQGCYLLAAIGKIDEKDCVELYVGSSTDTRKRFKRHIYEISQADDWSQRFHQRCDLMNVGEPLYIPLSISPTVKRSAHLEGTDLLDLFFDESMHIAILGLWDESNIKVERSYRTWEKVQEMKYLKRESFPVGWHGANCEIPSISCDLDLAYI